MAVNVYMVFFFSANPNSFLRYWWAYFLVCYGIPLIPSLWLLIAHGSDGQNVYGNATVSQYPNRRFILMIDNSLSSILILVLDLVLDR